MTWSEEVHNNRYHAAVSLATAERRLRKRGLPVPVLETAQGGPLMAMVAVASGLVAWQRWGTPVRSALAQNPLVQQFRTLIFGTSSSAPRPTASKNPHKNSDGGKVGARKPAVVAPTPAQAAAAAAEARLSAVASPQPQASARAVPPIPSRPAQTDPQPQASTSGSGQPAQQGGSGSGASKKKKGKKRR
ncbi:hypothetical protein PLESTB_000486700 [Pleodorina starrii]|uniref:Uncharacterized protein n=1 Tax=Pleodorina starrii TaxID=330485 RepID=A0A9W6BGN6_9CHLO|nr:hypothetical protein PLESTM_000357900 [Pleodorina starrii]GLC51292.1 hypothetical protein PLESTB_000486700 [Pleodorina starrii]GLC63652.1 hypothetical protein PLESTF_000059600 [Pleodorina starrii]